MLGDNTRMLGPRLWLKHADNLFRKCGCFWTRCSLLQNMANCTENQRDFFFGLLCFYRFEPFLHPCKVEPVIISVLHVVFSLSCSEGWKRLWTFVRMLLLLSVSCMSGLVCNSECGAFVCVVCCHSGCPAGSGQRWKCREDVLKHFKVASFHTAELWAVCLCATIFFAQLFVHKCIDGIGRLCGCVRLGAWCTWLCF